MYSITLYPSTEGRILAAKPIPLCDQQVGNPVNIHIDATVKVQQDPILVVRKAEQAIFAKNKQQITLQQKELHDAQGTEKLRRKLKKDRKRKEKETKKKSKKHRKQHKEL
jgi:hypothetical protein